MQDKLPESLKKLQIPLFTISGINVLFSESEERGKQYAIRILNGTIDRGSVLYLSGGRTPKSVYASIATAENFSIPAQVTLVDERFGKNNHKDSNELMLKETGILDYFSKNSVPFVSILEGKSREKTTSDFDQKLRELFAMYRSHVAILGVGLDGHTAGIPSDPAVWEEFDLHERMKTEMAIDYDDEGKFYNERVSMSFLALSMMDVFVVLVFGKDKKRALEWMFAPIESGFSGDSEEEVPSRFFLRPDIAPKTVLITDQEVNC